MASKLQNPKLLKISFYTFCNCKAASLHHQTKDPHYVKQLLDHKSTEIYITIRRTIFEPSSDEYTVKVAEEPEDIKSLLEAGFEYVCNKEELMFLRKRK
jgi:hypothetical protein